LVNSSPLRVETGLRLGEMEAWCLEMHGAQRFQREKLIYHSDKFTEYVCRCGRPCVVNRQKNIYKCEYCGDNAEPMAVPTKYASKIFAQELDSMNVGMRRYGKPYTYESNIEEEASSFNRKKEEK
jgi:DNA-directed RNA polymerase beta subunit